jgi:hypothetical protein
VLQQTVLGAMPAHVSMSTFGSNQGVIRMEDQHKLFAFKLATKQQEADKLQPQPVRAKKWKAREGVAIAGCTDPLEVGDYREGDRGIWC